MCRLLICFGLSNIFLDRRYEFSVRITQEWYCALLGASYQGHMMLTCLFPVLSGCRVSTIDLIYLMNPFPIDLWLIFGLGLLQITLQWTKKYCMVGRAAWRGKRHPGVVMSIPSLEVWNSEVAPGATPISPPKSIRGLGTLTKCAGAIIKNVSLLWIFTQAHQLQGGASAIVEGKKNAPQNRPGLVSILSCLLRWRLIAPKSWDHWRGKCKAA